MNLPPRPAPRARRAAPRPSRVAATTLLAGTLLAGALAPPATAFSADGHTAAGPVVGTAAASSGLGVLAATEDPVSVRTTWAVEPATATGPDGRVSYRLTVDPGGRTSDHVTVTNFSDHAATFDVYASDGVVTADGQFDLLPAGTAPTGGGSWITLGEGETAGPAQRVEIAAESSVTVPFTVAVPADATPGDHPAGVVAALARAEGDGGSVTFDTRVGARLHLRVAGDLAPVLGLTGVRATYQPSWNPFVPGAVRVGYTVVNQGNVRLGAGTRAGVAGPFGWNARDVDAPAQREVLPGQEASGSVVLDGVWPLGRVTGDLTTVPVVVGDDVVEVVLTPAGAGYGVWAMPWVQLGTVLVLVGAVLAVRRARRRGEARTQARIATALAHAGAPGSPSTSPRRPGGSPVSS